MIAADRLGFKLQVNQSFIFKNTRSVACMSGNDSTDEIQELSLINYTPENTTKIISKCYTQLPIGNRPTGYNKHKNWKYN